MRLLHARAHQGILGNEVADRLAERGKRCEGGCEECTEWAAAKAEELKRENEAGNRGRAGEGSTPHTTQPPPHPLAFPPKGVG